MFTSIHSALPRESRIWASPPPSSSPQSPASPGTNFRASVTTQNTTSPTSTTSSSRSSKKSNPDPPGPRSFLQQLCADEEAMRSRKLNIARFGSTWLRPAGVPKTLQAMQDEETEKAEVAEQERRARVMAEETAAAEAAARRGAGGFGGEGAEDVEAEAEGEEMEEGERDLDEEVPDAEEAMYEDEDPSLDATNTGEQDLDLDDDIPEAGSYQHTDTELEDASEIEIEQSGLARTPADAARIAQLQREMTESPQENESLDSSSPVARRAPRRDRGGPRARTSG